MPDTSPSPRGSGLHRRRERHHHRWPRLVVALIATGLLIPAVASTPDTARAASSCTGWTSKLTPPDTIRVGRADGTVDVVGLRTYVGVVMAKEWPAWMPAAALEAGATAVKQYGWFYTLEGRHRSSYVTAGGKCYDVRDSTVDQLYRPESVTVGSKIWRAVDATLGLSVRKSGRFFLTGYRAGSSDVCASDVDGTRLYARSVIACAERGWTREQIQRAYYAPDVTFHWSGSDTTPGDETSLNATIGAPRVSLVANRSLGQKHARVTWDQNDERPDGAHYQLQRLVDGSWRNVTLADPTRPRIYLNLAPGRTHRFRVRLRDAAGNVGPWYTGPSFAARLTQDDRSAFSWSGNDWQRATTSSASGGTVTHSDDDSGVATISFTGRSVAIVGTKGPGRGKAKVYVDNVLEGEIDLYAASNRWRVLVFTRTWAGSATHTIRLEVVGTRRVDVDALLFHR